MGREISGVYSWNEISEICGNMKKDVIVEAMIKAGAEAFSNRSEAAVRNMTRSKVVNSAVEAMRDARMPKALKDQGGECSEPGCIHRVRIAGTRC